MTFFAPYTSVMRLGQGFNSYTQEICIDDAVIVHSHPVPTLLHPQLSGNQRESAPLFHRRGHSSGESVELGEQLSDSCQQCLSEDNAPSAKPMSQTVTFTAKAIDSLADIVDALNISSSATINYGSAKFFGGTSIAKESIISESDINFIVSVKVTNEAPVNLGHMQFRPIPGLNPDYFPAVYGDCFIAGFLEGGEFSAIISIKVNDKSKISKVRLAAEVQLSRRLPVSGEAVFDKDKEDIWNGTEISISVNWTGGGEIKRPTSNWDFATVIAAANEFPSRVLKYSQKTSAILMNYNSLRSFHEANTKAEKPYVVLDYRLCVIKEPERYEAKEPSDEVPDPIKCDPYSLNLARTECRKGMTIILEETKLLAMRPELGRVNEDGTLRRPPYRFPGELEIRLPVCKDGSENGGSISPSFGDMIPGNGYVSHQPRALPQRAREVQPTLPKVGRSLYSVDGNPLHLGLHVAEGPQNDREQCRCVEPVRAPCSHLTSRHAFGVKYTAGSPPTRTTPVAPGRGAHLRNIAL
ncbi:hypothetical protein VTN00DRAFT_129 [Thermoascus crustaceus]|uniref:uncharacterized protein n=1 Tax=Thermoascus crustaceus TaxID=5088 RepID=UPI0037446639